MQALITTNNPLRLASTRLLSLLSPRAFVGWQSPMQLRDIPEPALPAEDWLVAKTRLCGLCGSDYKQVFMNGRPDNPMTAMISWPQVLGHEVVGEVEQVGGEVTNRHVGQRVLLNPWLSCVTRGLPPCEFCQQGRLAQCLNFGAGYLERGIHHGNSASATGGFAERVPGHESQWFPIPDGVSDEQAVLGDPFSVAFHAILKAPPADLAPWSSSASSPQKPSSGPRCTSRKSTSSAPTASASRLSRDNASTRWSGTSTLSSTAISTSRRSSRTTSRCATTATPSWPATTRAGAAR